jgi:CarD family transcriptional regulator
MFNLLEKIFIPAYGSGIVTNIENRKVSDKVRKYYIITLVLDRMSLYIPENKLDSYKIRKIESVENIVRCLGIIAEKPIKLEKRWNRRYRENNDKIASGIVESECEVLRDLYYLKKQGIMPPGEEKILYKAEGMLGSEMVLVMDISLEEAYEKLRSFSK